MHHIKPLLHLCLSFIAVVCLVAFIRPVLSQPVTSDIPYVSSSESFYAPVGDVSFAISNNAANIFTCKGFGESGNCSLWRRDIDEVIPLSGLTGNHAYWSIDNSRLVTVDNDFLCTSDTELYKLVYFETSRGTISRHCSSEAAILGDWSPIQPHKLFISSILDTNTLESASFSYPTSLPLANISQYWGYSDTFWDLKTTLPVGELSLTIEDNLHNQITRSQLEICTINGKDCSILLDTLTVAPALVFEYKLYKNWILWAGHLSVTRQALNIYDDRRSEIADTVLYLTDFHSGMTQEIFRFSSLGQSNVYVNKFAWSPDGKTIALDIKEINDLFLLPTLPPEGTPIPPPTYPPGIVLLHLEWPASANTD